MRSNANFIMVRVDRVKKINELTNLLKQIPL